MVLSYRFLKSKAIFQITLLIIASIAFSVLLSPESDADEKVCCGETTGGAYCVYTDESNCKHGSPKAATTCEQTEFCTPGCCFASDTGMCNTNVPKISCDVVPDSFFYETTSCDAVPVCQEGCCELGTSYSFGTKTACQLLIDQHSPDSDIDVIWNPSITDEATCIAQNDQFTQGCCVATDLSCTWTQQELCSTSDFELDGEGGPGFYSETYCSDPNLQCSCTAQDRTACLPGSDDAHWLDSCGNPEGIAEECDYYGEDGPATICHEEGGSASCISIDCQDTTNYPNNNHDPNMGGYRKNGESWCLYQGRVGPMNDLVGSRHYRAQCIDGQETVTQCRDFREEFCYQLIPTDNEGMSVASCVQNDGYKCAEACNKKPFDKKKNQNKQCCSEHASCAWVTPEDSNVGICVPIVPPGFDFAKNFETGPSYDGASLCNVADTTCTSTWKKSISGKWKCKQNCECAEDSQWASDVNNFCRSLGDCGAHYNVVGDFSKRGQRTSNAKNLQKANEKPFSYYEKSGNTLTSNYTLDAENGQLVIHGLDGDLLVDIVEIGGTIGSAAIAGAGLYSLFSSASFGGALQGLAGFLGPALVYLFVILVVIFIIFKLFGIGKTKTKIHKFNCAPWLPPINSDKCSQCKSVALDGECTEYLCRSLGSSCTIVNGHDPSVSECISTATNDVTPPSITPNHKIISSQQDKDGTSYTAEIIGGGNCGGFVVTPLVEPLTPFTWSLLTNELATCRYDTVHTETYEEMRFSFEEDNIYTLTHNVTHLYPGGKDYTYYVRCIDYVGNDEQSCEYSVKFTTKDEPDFVPPYISYTDPESGTAVAYEANSTLLTLYLNEPVELCKWSTENVPFEQMPNKFFCACDNEEYNSCTGDLPPPDDEDLCDYVDEGLFYPDTFECIGELTDIQQEQENIYYISCVDIEKNDGTGCNINNNYEFTVQGSGPLSITSVEPTEGTYYNPYFVIRVTTSGGAENGNAICYYDDGLYSVNEFFSTGGTTHIQEQNRTTGHYTYTFTCEDIAGNIATATTSVTLDVDVTAPVVENIYVDNGLLHIITDEISTCEYSTTGKIYYIGEGTVMQGSQTTAHSLLIGASTYHIICYDIYENINDPITVHL